MAAAVCGPGSLEGILAGIFVRILEALLHLGGTWGLWAKGAQALFRKG